MAILYVSEYTAPAFFNAEPLQMGSEPPVNEQTIAISGSSTQLPSQLSASTNFVRIHNDSSGPCCVAFGPNPTATTGNKRLAPNQTEYFAVLPRSQIAVISVAL
jgi:hypothetical protein